jgi:carbamoyltransferase
MRSPPPVVGIWDGHDAGAALIVEGNVVLALNEERLTGRKLEIGWPTHALQRIREHAGPLWNEARFALSTSDPAKTLTRLLPSARERHYRLRRRLSEPSWVDPLVRRAKYRLTQWSSCASLVAFTRRHTATQLNIDAARVEIVDHHAAHAAAAACWPQWESDTLVVTLDGVGDGLSGSVWRLAPLTGALTPLLRLPGSVSLGLFFEHVTEALQMRALEDEGKVMALASFSAPLPPAQNPFQSWFKQGEDPASGLPTFKCDIPPTHMRAAVERVVWRYPREQVCRGAQDIVEALVPTFFATLAARTGHRHFAYAGGVASNIKVNRLIRLTPGVDRLCVCPAMGDGGLALGAAALAWTRANKERINPFINFCLGPDNGDLAQNVEANIIHSERIARPPDIAAAVAALIADGEISMWAQGRMEMGARALGARSIVARADSAEARDALNLRLKRRVWYQPFCPSILDDEAPRLLADYRGPEDINRHMTMGYQCTMAGRRELAGAIGPDGSCRPQMVAPDSKNAWARLLLGVREHTGTGAVINTSLNLHGHPVPDTQADILAAWRKSGVRHLAIGSALLTQDNVP